MINNDYSFHLVAEPDGRLQGNRLNNFKIRLKNTIDLAVPYEVALIESSVPHNAYNISDDAYFCISRWVLKSKMKSRIDDEYRHLSHGKKGSEIVLDYAIRVKVPKGYYESIEHFKKVLQYKIDLLLNDEANLLKSWSDTNNDPFFTNLSYEYLDKRPLLKEMVHEYYHDALVGLNPDQKEFFIGLRLGKTLLDSYERDPQTRQVDALNNLTILHRMTHCPETGFLKFSIDTSDHAEEYHTVIRADSIINTVLGFNQTKFIIPASGAISPYQVKLVPYDTIFLYLNIIKNVIVSNSEVSLLRIIPIADKNPKFGQLLWTEYLNPQYIPLNSKHISYLHFELRDGRGEPILFQDSAHNVHFILHFRPIKRPNTN